MTTKKPQDHKPKAEPKSPERPEDVKGFHLLKPFNEVPVWEQTPVLALIAELTDGADDSNEIEVSKREAVLLLGEIAKALVPLAKDEKEFTKFCTGKNALQDVMNLAMAFGATLGEELGSEKN